VVVRQKLSAMFLAALGFVIRDRMTNLKAIAVPVSPLMWI